MTDSQGVPVASGSSLRAERLAVLSAAIVLTVLRSVVLVWFEGARFDSDQALLGLMAKHLVEGRAFPVFTYGQAYMLGVEAWMAAPFFLIGGATVAMLKLPLLLVNVAVSVLLVLGLEKYAGLRPIVALVPALFFVLAPAGSVTLLLEASGGNVEPFLVVLVLWLLRGRPLLFGAVLGFGVLQREFAVYGLGALFVMALVSRRLFTSGAWRSVGLGALGFAGVWQVVYLLKQFSSVRGPGTSAAWQSIEATTNLQALGARVCADPWLALEGLRLLVTVHLAELVGAIDRPLVDYLINSYSRQGADWLWWLLGPACLLMIGRVAQLALARGAARRRPPDYAVYLFLVGLQAVLVYALLRCGVVTIGEMRYALLGLFGMTGLVAGYLAVEPRATWRRAAVGLVLVWAAVSATGHARLAAEYLTSPPENGRRLLADRLVERGVRFAYGDFWDAYAVTFLTSEQVIVASTSVVFIDEYQWIVERRLDEAVEIGHEPCAGGEFVADDLYICPPSGRRSLPRR